MYIIYSDENFESIYGTIHKGDILETCMHEEQDEFFKYLFGKYGPNGQDIKTKWKKIE